MIVNSKYNQYITGFSGIRRVRNEDDMEDGMEDDISNQSERLIMKMEGKEANHESRSKRAPYNSNDQSPQDYQLNWTTPNAQEDEECSPDGRSLYDDKLNFFHRKIKEKIELIMKSYPKGCLLSTLSDEYRSWNNNGFPFQHFGHETEYYFISKEFSDIVRVEYIDSNPLSGDVYMVYPRGSYSQAVNHLSDSNQSDFNPVSNNGNEFEFQEQTQPSTSSTTVTANHPSINDPQIKSRDPRLIAQAQRNMQSQIRAQGHQQVPSHHQQHYQHANKQQQPKIHQQVQSSYESSISCNPMMKPQLFICKTSGCSFSAKFPAQLEIHSKQCRNQVDFPTLF
jgi:hypothetical protein